MKALPVTDTFSAERLLQLVKRIVYLNMHNWVIGILAVAGLLAAFWFIPVLLGPEPWHGHNTAALFSAFYFFYISGGLYLTSTLFDELHRPGTAQMGLTLPALASEKIAASWITGYFLYTIVAFAAFSILIPVVYFITLLATDANVTLNMFGILIDESPSILFNYLI